jgi:hypothetical protein
MITGTVRDTNTRAGLWLAHVVAFELDGTFIGGAVTDEAGRYMLDLPGPLREILLRVSYVGYADSSELVDSGSSWFDVDLTPATYELPEVEIFPEGGGASGGLLLLLLLLAASQS